MTQFDDPMWTVHDNGQNRGPYSERDLAQLVSTGAIGPNALAWREGLAQWIPASSAARVPPPVPPLPGSHHPAYAPSPAPESNRIVAGVLGILIGAFGVHKFVLGYTGAGLIMLLVTVLTCGFGGIVMGIIGLIEGILYLSKSEEDFHRTYVANAREWF